MQPGIHLSKVWFDEDVVELEVGVSDGTSFFSNRVYVGHEHLAEIASVLDEFKHQIHGRLFELRLGEFGWEYANGGFHARFRWTPSRLYVTCDQESEFEEFGNRQVASRATIYLSSDAAPFDRFVAELQSLVSGASDDAHLEAIMTA